MAYFQARSLADDDYEDFTESTADWYLRPLLSLEAVSRHLSSPGGLKIVDLGCGRAGLLRWLRERSSGVVQYVGVDQDEVAIARCQEREPDASFVVRDLRDPPTPDLQPPDLLFMVNVLPYLREPVAAMRHLHRISHSRTNLIVLDPHPALYWESEFGGFGLKLRDVATSRAFAFNAGWAPIQTVNLSVFAPSSSARLLIGHASSYSPRPGMEGSHEH